MARSVAILALLTLLCAVAVEGWGPWGWGGNDGDGDHHHHPPKPKPPPPCKPGEKPHGHGKHGKPCDPRGGGWGDPVFAGFDDTTVLFLGKAGKSYNVIASQDTHLNVALVDAELPEGSELAQLHVGQEGTFMSAFGLQYLDQRVLVEVDRMGILTSVKLNGTEQLIANNELHMEADVYSYMAKEVVVSVMRYRPFYGQSVKITTPDFDYMLYPTLAYAEEATGARIRGHLNVQVLSVHLTAEEADTVTGIMGDTLRTASEDIFAGRSTLRTDKVEPSKIQPFGKDEAAYEVAGLFEVEPAKPATVLVQARRLLAN